MTCNLGHVGMNDRVSTDTIRSILHVVGGRAALYTKITAYNMCINDRGLFYIIDTYIYTALVYKIRPGSQDSK